MPFCGCIIIIIISIIISIIIIIIIIRIAVIVVVITIITINISVLIFSKYFGMYLVVSPLRTDMSCHIFKTCWVVETSDLELLFSSGELTVKEKLKLLHAAMADYDSQAFPFRRFAAVDWYWIDGLLKIATKGCTQNGMSACHYLLCILLLLTVVWRLADLQCLWVAKFQHWKVHDWSKNGKTELKDKNETLRLMLHPLSFQEIVAPMHGNLMVICY